MIPTINNKPITQERPLRRYQYTWLLGGGLLLMAITLITRASFILQELLRSACQKMSKADLVMIIN